MYTGTLNTRLGRDRFGKPLATIDGMPGDYFEASPARLRELAAALMRIASDAEAEAAKPAPRRGSLPAVRRTYPTA